MKELQSLFEYIFRCFKRVEDAKALVIDRKRYEASLTGVLKFKQIEPPSGYNSSRLSWCFVNKNLVQASHITTCRDYFNESLQASINNTHHNYRPKGTYKDAIDLDKFRFIIFNANRHKLFDAIDILNLYSKTAGWTSAKATKAIFGPHDLNCTLIEADRNWMRYPQLMSVFMLIIRLIQTTDRSIKRFEYVRNICDLDAFWDELLKDALKLYGNAGRLPGNYSYLNHCYKYFIPLFMHEKEIFDKEMPDAWKGGKMDANSGIHSFLNGSSVMDHRVEAERLQNFYEVEVLRNEQQARKLYNRNGS